MKASILCIFFSCASALTISDKAIPKEGIALSNHSLQMKQKVMDGATMMSKIHSVSEKVRMQAPPKLWHALENSGLVELSLKVFNDTEFVKVALKHRFYKNSQVSSAIQTALQNDEFPEAKDMFPNGLDPELKDLSEATGSALNRQISNRELVSVRKSLSLIQSGPDSTFATNHKHLLYALVLPLFLSAFGTNHGVDAPLIAAYICQNYVLCIMTRGIGSSTDLDPYLPKFDFDNKIPQLNTEFGPFLKHAFMDVLLTGGQCIPWQIVAEVDRKTGGRPAAISKTVNERLATLATKANNAANHIAVHYPNVNHIFTLR